MSKPTSRIAVAVLIVLVIVAGVFITVQAASPDYGAIKGRADLTAADPYYASQQRGTPQKISPYNMDGNQGGHGGGCESEGFNSNDY